jgi:hypothetical protein
MDLIEKMSANPKYISSDYISAPRLAKKFKTTVEEIKRVRQLLRERDKPATKPTEPVSEIGAISGKISTVWKKSSNGGKDWDYSIKVNPEADTFYTREQLKEKMADLLPELSIVPIKMNNSLRSNNTLVIYLSDDHVGSLLRESIYRGTSKLSYEERLLKILAWLEKDYLV